MCSFSLTANPSAPPKPCLPILIVQLFFHRFTLIHFQGFPLFFPRSSRLPSCVFLRRGAGEQRENGPLLPGPRLGNHGARCFGPKRCSHNANELSVPRVLNPHVFIAVAIFSVLHNHQLVKLLHEVESIGGEAMEDLLHVFRTTPAN